MPTQDKHVSHTQGAGQIGSLAYKLTKKSTTPKHINSSTDKLINSKTHQLAN